MTDTPDRERMIDVVRNDILLAYDASDDPDDMAKAAIAAYEKELARQGFVVVPKEPTQEMLNAAVDVDSFRLGDISPLGFRRSPQQLFYACYRAMLSAQETEDD